MSDKPKKKVKKEPDHETKFKLIFSALFSRKMTYALFGMYDDRDTIMFTNISMDEAIIYEPKAAQYIHRVTLKDKTYVEWLYNLFPVLCEFPCIIDVNKLLLVLNKTGKDYHGVVLAREDSTIVVSGKDAMEVCGTVLDEHVASMYHAISKGARLHDEWFETTELATDGSLFKDSLVTVVMSLDDQEMYKVFGAQGLDMISVREYCKKVDTPCSVKLLTQVNGKAVRVKYVYNSEHIYVESVCPAMLWFPRHIKNIMKKKEM